VRYSVVVCTNCSGQHRKGDCWQHWQNKAKALEVDARHQEAIIKGFEADAAANLAARMDAEAQLAKVTAERDDYKDGQDNLRRCLKKAEAERDGLREALQRHGFHDDDSIGHGDGRCSAWTDWLKRCDCGLDEALAAVIQPDVSG
jgi:hypothetical protein